MKAKQKVAPTDDERNKREFLICDAVGKIAHETSIVETLAVAAVEVAARVGGDDRACRRRLANLATQIQNAAHEALESARALDAEVNPGAGPL